ncbi:conserved hypothetical protein [Verrucomicrobia bacterium]|nr:conserved hypothetical protein [Verrucomicrobiota bacterium]
MNALVDLSESSATRIGTKAQALIVPPTFDSERELCQRGSAARATRRHVALGTLALVCLLGVARAARGQGTQPVVAIHDSELTRALESMPASGATPTGSGTTGFQWWPVAWHYFVMPDSVKEALRSDGTAFTVLSDAAISAGALLNSNGSPKYPIFISLSSEAVGDNEIAQLTNYVAAGGTLLVGGSSFTRTTNGMTRGDFALANAMGVHMINASLVNWAADVTFSKLSDHPLVAHIPSGTLDWNMPVSADEISWGVSPSYLISQGHLCWQVQASDATVIAQGDAAPYLTIKPFGAGTIIYEAAMQPLLAHGGNAPGMYAYGIFRNAIQVAFASADLPVPKLSPWPYPFDAALEVRHDYENFQNELAALPISAQFELTNGAKGDYFFCTGTLRVEMTNSPSAIAGLRQAVTSYGATIGPHNGGYPNVNNFSLVLSNYDYWHWGTDEALDVPSSNLPPGFANGAAYGLASVSNSFSDVEGWLTGLTNGLRLTVSPHFNATREASYQIQQELGINATGEEKLGPFPSWVLSTSLQTPDMRYGFITLPTSDWYLVPPAVAQSMESGFALNSMHQLVDYYYNLGGLVNLYSHSSSAGSGLAGTLASSYVTYSISKPRIWPANGASIYAWWLARSNAQISATYTTNGNLSVVKLSISGAGDPQTAVEILLPRPSAANLVVLTNGVAAGPTQYRTNGPVVKVLIGTTITNAQISYLPNPEVQSSFYTVPQGKLLSVGSPGVLTGALPGAGKTLTARLVGSASDGTLSLSNSGAFRYTPASNFTGIDSFTFQANDGLATSSVARAVIDVTPPGNLFFDNFIRSTNSDPLAPWIPALATWTITSGQLQGINSDPGTHNDAYVPGNWTNYSVQGQFQFPANSFGGGLEGRLNPATGTKYAVDVYPNGIPGQTTSPIMRLLKFHSWQVLGALPMEQVVLPPIGTNWHTLQVTFNGPRILAYLDGAETMDVTDNGFDGLPAFASGGIGAHFFTYMTPYVANYADVQVTTAPMAVNDSYVTVQNRTLTVPAPGVLANDAPGLGTNLTASLHRGPTNGILNLNSNGGFAYTPFTNYLGLDTFTYEANDGFTNSAPATVTINVVPNSPPVANNDSYIYTPNEPFTIPAPGVLANDTVADGDALSAVLVNGPLYGSLNLSSTGGFTYTPPTNFSGPDAFTYVAVDGTVTSAVATVTLSDPSAGSLFYDDFYFSNVAGTNLPAPWIDEAGHWVATGGSLVGGTNAFQTYGFAYVDGWTNYSVQARLQFSPGAYGGGLGGELDPTTGAHYAAWVYPSGNNLSLIKFENWTTVTLLATVNLPPVGTNWHSVKLAFFGNQIAVYYDGNLLITQADIQPPEYLSGGISLDMYTYTSGYIMLAADVIVYPLAVEDSYSVVKNAILTVQAPGVLGNDTGVFSTTLAAALLAGPTNGSLVLNSNGGFTYMPSTNFTGMDSFIYQADNGPTNIGSAVVTISVHDHISPGTGPVIQGSSGFPSLVECSSPGGTLTNLFVTVSDGQGAPLQVVWTLNGIPEQTNTIAATGMPDTNTVFFLARLSLGSNSVLISASDGVSLTVFQTNTVIVLDTTPPIPNVASLPTITAQCSVIVTNVPTATDACAGIVVGTTTSPLTYTNQGTNVILWVYNDGNGNTSTQLQTVIVIQGGTAVLTCPPNVTITNGNSPQVCSFTPSEWGTEPDSTFPAAILAGFFSYYYTNGYLQVGGTGASNFSVKLTSANAVSDYLAATGAPGALTNNLVNPTTSSAGVFGPQVVALQLNVDFGDLGATIGLVSTIGNLVYDDPISPLNGQTVRQILALANSALGGSSLSAQGLTIASLSALVANLNAAFDGCQAGDWATAHLIIPAASVVATGMATATGGCNSHAAVTYSDVITPGMCPGSFTIVRTWLALDSSGSNSTCSQMITLLGATPSISGSVFLDCDADGDRSGKPGLPGVMVTLRTEGNVIATDSTDAKGNYAFLELAPGTYTIVVTPPPGYQQTYQQTWDPNGARINQAVVTLPACRSHAQINFGYAGDAPGVSLTQTGPAVARVGDTITYAFALTNTGNTCFYGLAVKDPFLGGQVFYQSPVSPGQGFVFTTSHVVTTSDPTTLVSTATAIGQPPNLNAVTAKSTWTVTVLTAPVGVVATAGNARVSLSWNAEAGATYNVKRSTINGGPYVTIQSLLAATNYTDTSVSNGVAYYYVVSAVTGGLEGPNSAQVSATPSAGLPSPWSTRDVGAVAATGGASDAGGTFTVTGSGADIWGTADAFRYVYQSAGTNCSIVARVVRVQATDPWAKAGVMIRDTLSASAEQASTFVTPSNGVAFQYRTMTGSSSGNVSTAGVTAPYWVKIVRQGNTFLSYVSSNGAAWTLLGWQTVQMSHTVYIGLAVTSHNNGVLCPATFDNVTVTP